MIKLFNLMRLPPEFLTFLESFRADQQFNQAYAYLALNQLPLLSPPNFKSVQILLQLTLETKSGAVDLEKFFLLNTTGTFYCQRHFFSFMSAQCCVKQIEDFRTYLTEGGKLLTTSQINAFVRLRFIFRSKYAS